MQLHQLSPIKTQKSKKRIGRGGKRGTYSGRGVKGQKSRAGRKLRPEWRDALKHIPKLRGYRFASLKNKPQILNLNKVNQAFRESALVTPKALLNKGLVTKIKGRISEIKILGDGELNKKLDFKGLKMSASARAKVEKAGGSIN